MLQKIIIEYATWIVFIPLLLSVLYYKRFPVALKNVTYYMIAAATTELLSYIMWKQRRNNLPLLHIYTIIEYLLLLKFYYSILKDFLPKVVFIILAVAPPIFFILDSLFIENIYHFNPYARSVESLIIIFLAMSWYLKLVSADMKDLVLEKSLKFINSAFLIYFSGSIVLFSFSDPISRLVQNLRLSIWTVHTLLTVTLYVLLALGLWKYRKQ
jgi:hypothetical protein